MKYLYLDENGIEDGYDTTFLFIYYLQKKPDETLKAMLTLNTSIDDLRHLVSNSP